ncbi:MAG: histidine phosphatase family protein [Aquificae bacterium]|nr:histidine phosphatase family protein [Aquificota bacterium]
MKRILLVRHAQSELNEKGVFQGSIDSDLTPLGFVQARLVAERLRRERPQLVVTSPQRRAYKTALTVADVLGLPLEVDERLKEMCFGELEGRPFWETFREKPELFRNWLKDPAACPLPGQEDAEGFFNRVRSFLNELLAREHDCVVVVGHGGSLHALVALALGLGAGKLWHFQLDNASVTELNYDGERFLLKYFNDTCHLSSLA